MSPNTAHGSFVPYTPGLLMGFIAPQVTSGRFVQYSLPKITLPPAARPQIRPSVRTNVVLPGVPIGIHKSCLLKAIRH